MENNDCIDNSEEDTPWPQEIHIVIFNEFSGEEIVNSFLCLDCGGDKFKMQNPWVYCAHCGKQCGTIRQILKD